MFALVRLCSSETTVTGGLCFIIVVKIASAFVPTRTFACVVASLLVGRFTIVLTDDVFALLLITVFDSLVGCIRTGTFAVVSRIGLV